MFFDFYSRLVRDFPDGCDQLFGQPLTADSSLWLSVDSDAYPSLLFSARRDDNRSDIQLRSISACFSRDCVIETADGTGASGIYTIVRLNENDPDIVHMLLKLLEVTFKEREKSRTNREIASRILELAELFKRIGDSTGDIVGLWGELYILSRSKNLNTAVQCWCQHKHAKYDYVTDDFALEAKTTVLSKRKHSFSLEQLRPNGDFHVYIASLIVVEVNSGRSTSELIDELYRNIIDNDLRARFFTQCLIKGGWDIYQNTLRLNILPDQASLAIFDASNIPVPEISPAWPIDNVRFDVDLTDLVPISRNEMDVVLAFGMK